MGHYVRRSREERLQEIQMAALELFLDKGYNSTTMEDIIHATTLSKGGFYNYYKSKDEILADLVRKKNLNYIKQEVDTSNCHTMEDVCDVLAKAFVARMTDPTPQSRLHLMIVAEWAGGNQYFEQVYNAVERESLNYLVRAILQVFPGFDEQAARGRLLLIYRINNTLHLVKKLYRDNMEIWGIDHQLLYETYYHMLQQMLLTGLHQLPKDEIPPLKLPHRSRKACLSQHSIRKTSKISQVDPDRQ